MLNRTGQPTIAKTDLAYHKADAFGEGLRLGPLPLRRGASILCGGLGLQIPVLPEFGQHAPFLLLPGDLDEDVLRDGGVLAAFIPDRLGSLLRERDCEIVGCDLPMIFAN